MSNIYNIIHIIPVMYIFKPDFVNICRKLNTVVCVSINI